MKYRIKQVGDKFYPQCKNFLGWKYYKGRSYWTYNFMLEKVIDWENLYFESFENANNFLIGQKKSDNIVYHNMKEE